MGSNFGKTIMLRQRCDPFSVQDIALISIVIINPGLYLLKEVFQLCVITLNLPISCKTLTIVRVC